MKKNLNLTTSCFLLLLFFLNITVVAQRQTNNLTNANATIGCVSCIGSLGPDLITNGNFSSGNTGFLSDLTFVATDEVGSGSYGVRNSSTFPSAIPHPGMWTCTDHSGGNSGFMVVNSKYNSTVQSFWKSTITVEQNTRYILCFYVNNIIEPKAPSPKYDPQIQVKVNGQLIKGPITISVLPDAWATISKDWNSGSSTQAVIEIQDITPQESYNDFAMDDISFRKCTPIEFCGCKNWSSTQLTIKYSGENGQVSAGFKCTDPSELIIPYVCTNTQITVMFSNYNCSSTGPGCPKYVCEVRNASNSVYYNTTVTTTNFSFNVPSATNTGVYTIRIIPYCNDNRCEPCTIKINIKKIGNINTIF